MSITERLGYAGLILRVTLGVLFIIHSGLKIFVFTPAGAAQFFESVGLPASLAYITIIWEIVIGVALILGVWTSFVALLGIPIMLGAIIFVHGSAGFFFNNPNGGWEYPAFWAIALAVQFLIGDGFYALRPKDFFTKENLPRAAA
ncbi:DoxX family protein [Ensifer adhaerens]|uniref:DoxX family protein n=1 Tax=Ensifer adhaerens TaxID=106592 RepID=A0A9Q9DE82_ENSAD|nr:DoxX family protein [Ensifer adhaerens]USJ28419.1 DoxX family protein [Ensifer adhaerens]